MVHNISIKAIPFKNGERDEILSIFETPLQKMAFSRPSPPLPIFKWNSHKINCIYINILMNPYKKSAFLRILAKSPQGTRLEVPERGMISASKIYCYCLNVHIIIQNGLSIKI